MQLVTHCVRATYKERAIGAASKPQWRQQANSHVTACQTKHVCSDAKAGGRVAKIAGMVNQRGDERGDYFHL